MVRISRSATSDVIALCNYSINDRCALVVEVDSGGGLFTAGNHDNERGANPEAERAGAVAEGAAAASCRPRGSSTAEGGPSRGDDRGLTPPEASTVYHANQRPQRRGTVFPSFALIC